MTAGAPRRDVLTGHRREAAGCLIVASGEIGGRVVVVAVADGTTNAFGTANPQDDQEAEA